MNSPTRSILNLFELVYPPISDQEATWLRRSRTAEPLLRRSDLYMIGIRPNARFDNFRMNSTNNTLRFDLLIGEHFKDDVLLNLDELPTLVDSPVEDYEICMGDKIVQIWDSQSTKEEEADLVEWFTTERLLWARQHDGIGIYGLDKFLQALTYELLYIGIAKTGDSFDRLIRQAHRTRQDILSSEYPRLDGARVSDEVVLFLFAAARTIEVRGSDVTSLSSLSQLDDVWDQKKTIADAEKAFVSTLHPEYNRQQFKNYPKGLDGLYNSGLTSYGYMIRENLTFTTSGETFRGGRESRFDLPSNRADAIFVTGDSVEFMHGTEE